MYEEENPGAWGNEQMVLTPIGSVDTLYPQVGDAVGLIMFICLIGLLIFAWIKRKSKER